MLLALASLAWLVVVALLLRRVLRDRRDRLRRNARRSATIPTVPVERLDPVFRRGPFGPTLDTEVAFVGGGNAVPHGTTDFEAWILAVLARRARLLFEFGTCTGRTAYLWARNAPPDARVVTITLRPENTAQYRAAAGDAAADQGHALEESAFTDFLYSGTDVAGRIEQLFGDGKQLDESPWAGQCDVVFVDGSRAHSYVLSDSEKARRLVRPGGLVLWHDFWNPDHSPGVWSGLHELAARLPLVHVHDTKLVAYRRPAAA